MYGGTYVFFDDTTFVFRTVVAGVSSICVSKLCGPGVYNFRIFFFVVVVTDCCIVTLPLNTLSSFFLLLSRLLSAIDSSRCSGFGSPKSSFLFVDIRGWLFSLFESLDADRFNSSIRKKYFVKKHRFLSSFSILYRVNHHGWFKRSAENSGVPSLISRGGGGGETQNLNLKNLILKLRCLEWRGLDGKIACIN